MVQEGSQVVEFINFREVRLRWMADWYESQEEVHLTGPPLERGREISGSFTLAARDGRAAPGSVGSSGSTVGGSVAGVSTTGGSTVGGSTVSGSTAGGSVRALGVGGVGFCMLSNLDKAVYIHSVISSAWTISVSLDSSVVSARISSSKALKDCSFSSRLRFILETCRGSLVGLVLISE